MDQVDAGNRRRSTPPLLEFPFRLFFMSSALSAAILVPLWLWLWTSGPQTLALPPLLWHQHEMLAGFVNAAIAGFVLTAICNWTGTPPLSGRRLLGLWLLWLAGRLGMAFGADAPLFVTALDLAFMPAVTASVGLRVWQARQRRRAATSGRLKRDPHRALSCVAGPERFPLRCALGRRAGSERDGDQQR